MLKQASCHAFSYFRYLLVAASIFASSGLCQNRWGNPAKKEFYDYMASYSPMDNVRTSGAAYPNILATGVCATVYCLSLHALYCITLSSTASCAFSQRGAA